ncbi:hypothetical protein MOV61_22080, partial [Neorhizobium sp. BETTINA12A]|uniref:hypothetical protein n=1 Tax=Neorhizobium sp. BETTINA12A TaxID=2908924 RepID=UPI001FF16F16
LRPLVGQIDAATPSPAFSAGWKAAILPALPFDPVNAADGPERPAAPREKPAAPRSGTSVPRYNTLPLPCPFSLP